MNHQGFLTSSRNLAKRNFWNFSSVSTALFHKCKSEFLFLRHMIEAVENIVHRAVFRCARPTQHAGHGLSAGRHIREFTCTIRLPLRAKIDGLPFSICLGLQTNFHGCLCPCGAFSRSNRRRVRSPKFVIPSHLSFRGASAVASMLQYSWSSEHCVQTSARCSLGHLTPGVGDCVHHISVFFHAASLSSRVHCRGCVLFLGNDGPIQTFEVIWATHTV